jgi:hypothetical protein
MSNYSEPNLNEDTDHDLLFKAAYALYLQQQGGGGGSLPDQTGHAGEFLTTNGTTASWAEVSTSSALPVWTYEGAGVSPTSGGFSPDNVNINATSSLRLSYFATTGTGNWSTFLLNLPPGASLMFTGEDEVTSVFSIGTAPTDPAGTYIQFQVNPGVIPASAWSGQYKVSFGYATAPSMAMVQAASSITPVADGSYTVGIGNSQNGIIQVTQGIIVSVQEAQN